MRAERWWPARSTSRSGCAVVLDPFGNALVLLDTSKGRLVTEPEGKVIGVDGR
jgi:hypothetical protein